MTVAVRSGILGTKFSKQLRFTEFTAACGRRISDVPLQPFQDNIWRVISLGMSWLWFAGARDAQHPKRIILRERETRGHFVLPFFDVNIGHAIKNQDSPVVSHDWSSKKRNDHDTLC